MATEVIINNIFEKALQPAFYISIELERKKTGLKDRHVTEKFVKMYDETAVEGLLKLKILQIFFNT